MGPTWDRSESVENPESYGADLKACQQACAETLTLRTTSSFFPRPPILSSPRLPTAAAALSAGLWGGAITTAEEERCGGGAHGCSPLAGSPSHPPDTSPTGPPASRTGSFLPSLLLYSLLIQLPPRRHFSAAHGNWVPRFVCHVPCKFPLCPFCGPERGARVRAG